MGEQSRIKFNPVTQEIEIEGSEQFIKTYFDKIQTMLSGAKEGKLVKESRRGSKSNAVLALIRNSPEGITTTELKEKTGLTERQIWSITSIAKKIGKIKKAKRGMYVGT
jgi:hypothetical protein